MKRVGAVVAVGILLVLGLSLWHRSVPASLQSFDSLVVTRDSVNAEIHAPVDSGASRTRLVYVRQDNAQTLERLAQQQDSLAGLAVKAQDYEQAYSHEHARADALQARGDTLAKALEDALVASAYHLTAYLADSTQRAKEWRVATALASDLRRATKRKALDYVAVGCGYGLSGPTCFVGVRVPLGR